MRALNWLWVTSFPESKIEVEAGIELAEKQQ
jgi:hypothetical protein